jgi:choline monooxygenase
VSYAVDVDVASAHTLPGSFYSDRAAFEASRERIFARTWQWIGDLEDAAEPGTLSPRTLLPGLLDEPLLLARDGAGQLRCLSNVCTHRGNILVGAPCRGKEIRCGYHSRRFDLAGRMTFMPEFSGARDFPSDADNLPAVPFAAWNGLGFAGVAPVAPLKAFMGDMASGLEGVALEGLRADPARNRDFEIEAHWALYVENYLEGFHIPFVHPGLAQAIDYGTYQDELFRYASVQVARDGAGAVNARYWWIFPNLMLNFYAWGLSVNHVQPLAPDRTRVLFRSYVRDPSQLASGPGGALDRVEAEDEAIVLAVQRGVRSRFYGRGRYSPTRERGVHHFHRLLCEFLSSPTVGIS